MLAWFEVVHNCGWRWRWVTDICYPTGIGVMGRIGAFVES